MDKNALAEALNKALEMEEKGYKFYIETAANCENTISKKAFNFLADNEVLHIQNIKHFYDTLQKKGELPKLDLDDVRATRIEDAGIFAKTIKDLKEKVKKSDDEKKACEFAMQFEKDGYAYYENMLKDTNDENLTKLLKFLLNEENDHYEWIMNLHAYLTDSHNWFMYEEGSFPQG